MSYKYYKFGKSSIETLLVKNNCEIEIKFCFIACTHKTLEIENKEWKKVQKEIQCVIGSPLPSLMRISPGPRKSEWRERLFRSLVI